MLHPKRDFSISLDKNERSNSESILNLLVNAGLSNGHLVECIVGLKTLLSELRKLEGDEDGRENEEMLLTFLQPYPEPLGAEPSRAKAPSHLHC